MRRFTLQNINYHFDYDDLYQLTAESGHKLHRYRFDSLSNRKEKDIHEEKHNNLHQLLASGEESFDYDLNGNMSKRIKDGIETIYTHDALDRLSTVTSKGKTFTYNYDAFNRRIAKISPDKEELFLYQEQEEIGIVENGIIRQLKLGAKEGSGSMLVIELDGELYYPIKDLFGNVSTLLNSEGKTVESYRYTAFGEMEILAPTDTILSSSVIGNPWRYACKRVDPDTGLISFGLRDYDSSLGRWVTPDPAGFGDGPNLYAYVHNRPLVLFDSYGLFSKENNDSSPTFEGSQESMWNRTCGGLHGALDFCLNQCYGLGSDCCIYGTGLNEDMLSFDERWNAFTSYEETQAQFSMEVERGIQNFLQVDENCAAYQDSRQITTTTLEFASLAAGAYGLSRGLLAGGRSLIRTGANQTGYRRLFSKPVEQIAKNGEMLNGPACSSINAVRLKNSLIAKEIAGGHAYEKHILTRGEFSGFIRTRKQFAEHIECVLNNPTTTKQLSRNRIGYWHQETGTVVVWNPKAIDGGTAFQPIDGMLYYEVKLK